MTATQHEQDQVAAEVAVSRRCQDGLHLWCGALAGRFGQWPCGCACHDHGRHVTSEGRAA
jgi:hypothetical protein